MELWTLIWSAMDILCRWAILYLTAIMREILLSGHKFMWCFIHSWLCILGYNCPLSVISPPLSFSRLPILQPMKGKGQLRFEKLKHERRRAHPKKKKKKSQITPLCPTSLNLSLFLIEEFLLALAKVLYFSLDSI